MQRPWMLPVAALALTAGALLGESAWSAPESATWEGDPQHSFVLFKIKHLNASWVWGRFNQFSVSAQCDGSQLGAVTFSVKTESVDTGVPDRDAHLRKPDFFNAKQFPEITFKSTKVVAAGEGWDVTGDLSMHGVTKSITIPVAKVGEGKGMHGESLMGFESVFTLKRSDFDMKTMVGPVGDDVHMDVCVETNHK